MSKQRTKYHVRKRIFLNRDLDMRAYAIAIVEDTRDIPNAEGDAGWVELVLSDCYRHVSYDFNLRTKESRTDALYKIRRLAAIVNSVKEAIEIEAASIDEKQKAKSTEEKQKAKAASG